MDYLEVQMHPLHTDAAPKKTIYVPYGVSQIFFKNVYARGTLGDVTGYISSNTVKHYSKPEEPQNLKIKSSTSGNIATIEISADKGKNDATGVILEYSIGGGSRQRATDNPFSFTTDINNLQNIVVYAKTKGTESNLKVIAAPPKGG